MIDYDLIDEYDHIMPDYEDDLPDTHNIDDWIRDNLLVKEGWKGVESKLSTQSLCPLVSIDEGNLVLKYYSNKSLDSEIVSNLNILCLESNTTYTLQQNSCMITVIIENGEY